MPQRVRKLVGTVVLVVFISVYALLAMTLAAARLPGTSGWTQLLYFVVAGLLWVVPTLPLISWMQRPDQRRA